MCSVRHLGLVWHVGALGCFSLRNLEPLLTRTSSSNYFGLRSGVGSRLKFIQSAPWHLRTDVLHWNIIHYGWSEWCDAKRNLAKLGPRMKAAQLAEWLRQELSLLSSNRSSATPPYSTPPLHSGSLTSLSEANAQWPPHLNIRTWLEQNSSQTTSNHMYFFEDFWSRRFSVSPCRFECMQANSSLQCNHAMQHGDSTSSWRGTVCRWFGPMPFRLRENRVRCYAK